MSEFQHILAAIDFSAATLPVLGRSASLVQDTNGELTLIHVVDYLPPIGFPDDLSPAPSLMLDEEVLLENARQSLQKCVSHLPDGITPRLEVRMGAPKHEITQFAEGHGCDLIVIGSHGRRGIERLLGSTADAVLHRAPCDVLAVRILDNN